MSDPRDFVVFDTETTGMPPSARLVEIGALKVRGNNIVDRFESLVFPECPIPAEVIAIHGITDTDVADAPLATKVIPEFLEWADGRPLVGHNVVFDAGILAAECVRLGMNAPHNRTFCTLRSARKHLQRKSHSLSNLVEELNLPAAEHHRASADATHTLNLLWYMQDMLGDKVLVEGLVLSSYSPDIPKLPESKRLLTESARLHQAVEIRYRMRDGRLLPMRVSPRFFFRRKDTICMEALCHHARYYKSYRLERIASVHPLPDAEQIAVEQSLWL